MTGPTTSDLRQAVCAAITGAVTGNKERADWLARCLDVQPYDRRTDSDLIDLAYSAGVPEARVAEIATLDAGRRPDYEQLHICPDCLDQGHVRGGDGRFYRCQTCNPPPGDYIPEKP